MAFYAKVLYWSVLQGSLVKFVWKIFFSGNPNFIESALAAAMLTWNFMNLCYIPRYLFWSVIGKFWILISLNPGGYCINFDCININDYIHNAPHFHFVGNIIFLLPHLCSDRVNSVLISHWLYNYITSNLPHESIATIRMFSKVKSY